MKRLLNQKGFTLTELIVAMAVLAILGSVVTSLVKTGLSAYGQVSGTASAETEARTALSLVTTQLRRHDATGAVMVLSSTRLGLREDPGAGDGGNVVWFDAADGTVYTAQVSDVTQEPEKEKGNAIAAAEGLAIEQVVSEDHTSLAWKVTVIYDGGKELSQTITQRSAAMPLAP